MQKQERITRLRNAIQMVYEMKKMTQKRDLTNVDAEIEKVQQEMSYWQKVEDRCFSGIHILFPDTKKFSEADRHKDLCHQKLKMLKKVKEQIVNLVPLLVPQSDVREGDECTYCGKCSNLILSTIESIDGHRYYVFVCEECVIKRKSYCVVCGKIDQNNSGITTSSYHICDECLESHQGDAAITQGIVGQCSKCGRKDVSLWLHGEELLCEKCYNK